MVRQGSGMAGICEREGERDVRYKNSTAEGANSSEVSVVLREKIE